MNNTKQSPLKPLVTGPLRLPPPLVITQLRAVTTPRAIRVAVTLNPESVFAALDLKPLSAADTIAALQETQARISDQARTPTERANAQTEYMKHLLVLLLQQGKML